MPMPLTKPSPAELAVRLNLAPHPEGGYYAETYRAAGVIPAVALPPEFGGERNYSTSILYLLTEGDKSRLHRIRQDEVWHFHLGGPLRLVMISPEGVLREVILGPDILSGQLPQFAVPAGCWFGAAPLKVEEQSELNPAEPPESHRRPDGAWPPRGAGYCLMGCTVAPGFDFADFELADGRELIKSFPAQAALIAEFT